MDLDPAFLLPQVVAGIARGMLLFLVAAGLSLIFGVMNVLNFAHATFWLLGGYIAWTVIDLIGPTAGASPWAVVPAALVAGGALFVVGAFVERALVSRMYARPVPEQLLLTFALVLIVGDLIKMIWGVSDRSVFLGLAPLEIGSLFVNAWYLVVAGVGLGTLAGLQLFLRKTRFGRIVRAAVHDREMVSALGIRIATVYTVVFGVGVALAGVAGAIALPLTPLALGADIDFIVQCFAVVVIGGFGSIAGTFVGAMLVGVTYSVAILAWPDGAVATVFLIVIAVLVVRPWGLFGSELRT